MIKNRLFFSSWRCSSIDRRNSSIVRCDGNSSRHSRRTLALLIKKIEINEIKSNASMVMDYNDKFVLHHKVSTWFSAL